MTSGFNHFEEKKCTSKSKYIFTKCLPSILKYKPKVVTQVKGYRDCCPMVLDVNYNLFYKESKYLFTQEIMAIWMKK